MRVVMTVTLRNLVNQGIERCGRHARVDFVGIDQHRRTASAVAQAIHGFERDRAVFGRLMEIDAERLLRVRFECARSERLACLRAADAHDMATGRDACGNGDRN